MPMECVIWTYFFVRGLVAQSLRWLTVCVQGARIFLAISVMSCCSAQLCTEKSYGSCQEHLNDFFTLALHRTNVIIVIALSVSLSICLSAPQHGHSTGHNISSSWFIFGTLIAINLSLIDCQEITVFALIRVTFFWGRVLWFQWSGRLLDNNFQIWHLWMIFFYWCNFNEHQDCKMADCRNPTVLYLNCSTNAWLSL